MPPLEAALRNLISVGCLSETIAVSIIRAEHAELEGSALGEVLRGILADEVQHARLGWKMLGLCVPLLDEGARQRLSAYLVDALAHQIAHEIPLLPILSQPTGELARAGVCDGGFGSAPVLRHHRADHPAPARRRGPRRPQRLDPGATARR